MPRQIKDLNKWRDILYLKIKDSILLKYCHSTYCDNRQYSLNWLTAIPRKKIFVEIYKIYIILNLEIYMIVKFVWKWKWPSNFQKIAKLKDVHYSSLKVWEKFSGKWTLTLTLYHAQKLKYIIELNIRGRKQILATLR